MDTALANEYIQLLLSKEYIEEEKRAKDMKKGIWKSRFIYPWEWRREKRKKNKS